MFATRLLKLIGGPEGMAHPGVKEYFPHALEAIQKAVSRLGLR